MTNTGNIVGSFAKGLQVLECFGTDHPRLAITDLARMTGLDRATARRCLLTLHELGYASYDGKFFALTPRVLRLGLGALAALPLPQIVQPWLDQMSEQIGQSCSASMLDDTDIVYLARAAQRRVMSIGLLPGSRLPAHCTSMGRVLLAYLPNEDMRDVLARSDLTPRAPNSLHDPADIMAELARIRANGYATINQEVEQGLSSLAVPIYDARGRVVAALNTGMATPHATPGAIRDIYLPALIKVQEGLRRCLTGI